jgi:hypothetical protein
MIQRKAAGKPLEVRDEEQEEEAPDLMEALEASLAASR